MDDFFSDLVANLIGYATIDDFFSDLAAKLIG
jgi:hypothetical protein